MIVEALRPPFPPIEELLPHRGAMLLLDAVVATDEANIETALLIPAAGWYLDQERRMPAWIGIELMAQTIAAHASLLARARGEPSKCGVLLGSRNYRAHTSAIAAGERIRVSAALRYSDESGFAAYDCRIIDRRGELAAADVKVFQPQDFGAFLEQAAGS